MLRCLEALLELDHPDYEVLICDNGSRDGTAEARRQRAASAASRRGWWRSREPSGAFATAPPSSHAMS